MKKRAVFFDRDGVINVDHGYVYDPKDFDFVSGIFELLSFFKSQGYLLLVATNQSGIARGYYSMQDFLGLTDFMQEQIRSKLGFGFDKVYFCPHASGCKCRKPEIGMVKEACGDFDLDLGGSIMIGDKQSDMEFAQNAGIGKKYFLSLKKPTDMEHISDLHWVLNLAQLKNFVEQDCREETHG